MRFSSFLALSAARRAVVAALGLSLAACASVPVTSLWALRHVDPVTTDPARLFAAVRHPAALRLRPGDIKLALAQARRDGSERQTVEIALDIVDPNDRASGAPPPPPAGVGQAVTVLRVPPAARGRFDAFRAVVAWRSRLDPDGYRGAMTLTATACSVGREPATGPVVIDTFLSADGAEGFVPVAVGVDLAALAAGSGGIGAAPACATP